MVATEMCVKMSDERIRCIVHFITNITRNRWMIPSVMVVEILYRFKMLVAVYAGVISHLIYLKFPEFVFVWGGGLIRFPEGIFAIRMSFSEFDSFTVFALVGLIFVSLLVSVVRWCSL